MLEKNDLLVYILRKNAVFFLLIPGVLYFVLFPYEMNLAEFYQDEMERARSMNAAARQFLMVCSAGVQFLFFNAQLRTGTREVILAEKRYNIPVFMGMLFCMFQILALPVYLLFFLTCPGQGQMVWGLVLYSAGVTLAFYVLLRIFEKPVIAAMILMMVCIGF